jgi:uncharacterized protein YndB with AHSA1/START domain
MPTPAPLSFVFYFAAAPEKVWEGFVSPESNKIIFMGADFTADLQPGGSLLWTGPGPDGKPMTYVEGKVIRAEAPKLLEYHFIMGPTAKPSRVLLTLTPETEATKVEVIQDEWEEEDKNYKECAQGWPRILSRLKTLIETGKTFKPH